MQALLAGRFAPVRHAWAAKKLARESSICDTRAVVGQDLHKPIWAMGQVAHDILVTEKSSMTSDTHAVQVQDLQAAINEARSAEEQGRGSMAAELAESRRQLDEVTHQLADAQQRQARAASKAEEQADRADKWESECIGARSHPTSQSAAAALKHVIWCLRAQRKAAIIQGRAV